MAPHTGEMGQARQSSLVATGPSQCWISLQGLDTIYRKVDTSLHDHATNNQVEH